MGTFYNIESRVAVASVGLSVALLLIFAGSDTAGHFETITDNPKSESAYAGPIIDMHLHAYSDMPPGESASWTGEPEARALAGAVDAEGHLMSTLAEMDKYNIVLGVVSGAESAVRRWHKKAPGRFIGGAYLGNDGLPEHSPAELNELVDEGVMGVLGELGLQYHGIDPDDTRLHEYYDIAETMEIAVALHTGLGPPGGPHTFAPEFRTTLGRPSLFEPVLVRHPNLKAYLMHAGWPYISETIALMYIYPDLYADVGVLAWALPRDAFYDALRSLVNAGFGERLLFGTDQMLWPGAVGLAVNTLENVPFLTDQQKQDIFYNNAARFLELSDEEIKRHHEK